MKKLLVSVLFMGIVWVWMGSPRTQAGVPVPHRGIFGRGNAGEGRHLQRQEISSDGEGAQNTERITRYTLTAERDRKARALAAVRLRQSTMVPRRSPIEPALPHVQRIRKSRSGRETRNKLGQSRGRHCMVSEQRIEVPGHDVAHHLLNHPPNRQDLPKP